jgi:hypothetical protein
MNEELRKQRLISALMENDCLGMKILTVCKANTESILRELARECHAHPNVVCGKLAEITALGGLRVNGAWFECTKDGSQIVERLGLLSAYKP